MVVFGKEIFFIAPNSLCEIKNPLDDARDLIEYHASAFLSSIQLFPGNLAVFESLDVHAGGISANAESSLVQKVVVKVPKQYVKLNF